MRSLIILGVTMGVALTMFTSCIGAGNNSTVLDQGSNKLPKMTGIDLHGKERVVPDTFEGKLNIVTIGFEREHQTPINTWIAEAEQIMAKNDHIRFYELPLIYEMNPATRWWVNNGMRSGIPDEAARARTITIYTNRDAFLDMMNMSAEHIYVLLVDDKGTIVWREKNAITDATKQSLNQFIERYFDEKNGS